MTRHLVFTGPATGFAFRDGPDPEPPSEEKPKKDQCAQHGRRYLARHAEREMYRAKPPGTGYRPGKLMDLAEDQCRYSLPSSPLCCGAQTYHGLSWCPEHDALVHPTGKAARAKLAAIAPVAPFLPAKLVACEALELFVAGVPISEIAAAEDKMPIKVIEQIAVAVDLEAKIVAEELDYIAGQMVPTMEP